MQENFALPGSIFFSKFPKFSLLAFFWVTSNGNKLEEVANQMNLNTNLDSVKGLLN